MYSAENIFVTNYLLPMLQLLPEVVLSEHLRYGHVGLPAPGRLVVGEELLRDDSVSQVFFEIVLVE